LNARLLLNEAASAEEKLFDAKHIKAFIHFVKIVREK
jgi:hypothetical protein